jgi:prepilin-type processing-associated H-X9-DG protein
MMGVLPYVKNYDIYRDPLDTEPINAGTGPKYSYWANGVMAWGNGFEFRGVVNPNYGFTTSYYQSRSTSGIVKPAEVIFFCMRKKNPYVGYISGVWDPWYGVITIHEGVDQTRVLPGQYPDCWSVPNPTWPGLIDGSYAGRSNFAMTDGHAKTLNPFQTVNMSANRAGGWTDNKFLKMWDALEE